MSFFEALVRALIYICLIAAGYYLTLWVLSSIGLRIPGTVELIFGIILVLVAILMLYRLFLPFLNAFTWFPPRR